MSSAMQQSKNSEKIRVGIVPVGDIPEIATKSIAAHLLGYMNVQPDILPPLKQPEYAFDQKRLQYNAAAILAALESGPFLPYSKVIGVLDVDIFVPILTHVFGEARQGGDFALVSLYRLRKHEDGSTPPVSLLLERAAKVALHEAGHLFSLVHCLEKRCVMNFSGDLQHLDNIPILFCRYCSAYLRDAFHRLVEAHGPYTSTE